VSQDPQARGKDEVSSTLRANQPRSDQESTAARAAQSRLISLQDKARGAHLLLFLLFSGRRSVRAMTARKATTGIVSLTGVGLGCSVAWCGWRPDGVRGRHVVIVQEARYPVEIINH
jgi:hypothetical protein